MIDHLIRAHSYMYNQALSEIKNGKKISHWIWYIFPQLLGLGKSEMSQTYAIKDREHAKEYMNNELLHYKEELQNANDEIDGIRQQWWDEIERTGQNVTESKRIEELTEYCNELEQKVDMYEREIQSLRQQIEIMEEAEVHRSEHQKAVESGKVVEIQEAKLQRASKEDAKRMRELRDEGYKIHEIAEMTGFSVSTVKRKIY